MSFVRPVELNSYFSVFAPYLVPSLLPNLRQVPEVANLSPNISPIFATSTCPPYRYFVWRRTRLTKFQGVDMNVLVCDLGFSSAKWIYGERKGRIISAFSYNGDNLLIGEDSLMASGSSYLKTMEELVRYYPVFVEQCLKQAGCEGDILLAVGLPYSYWQEQHKPAGAVPALAKSLTDGAIKDVAVFPQGLGGLRDYLDGLPERPTGNVLGIDIGFNTIIFTLFSPQKKQIIHGKTLNKRGSSPDGNQLSAATNQEPRPIRHLHSRGNCLPDREGLFAVRLRTARCHP